MAQDKILGEQLDVVDVSGDIANDPTAIDNIATGVANDPTALASLEAAVDHTNIVNGGGTNSHTQIDSHIVDGTLHFTEASINITTSQVSDYTTNTANIADTQIAAANIGDLSNVNFGSPLPSAGQLLTYSGSPAIWAAEDAPISGLQNIVEDTTPQLGGHLDTNGLWIITSDISTATNADDIQILSGDNSYAGGGQQSGDVIITGGEGTNNNFAGAVNITSGNATGGKSAGILSLTGGTTDTGWAGVITLTGGASTSTANAGPIHIKGGAAAGSGAGGYMHIFAGANSGTGVGGDITIAGGGAGIGYQSGSVKINAGAGTGAIPGTISIHPPTLQVGQAALQFWNDTNTAHTLGFYNELKVSASLAANLTLTLPITDGLIGQTLQTDASGVLSFGGPALYNGTGTPEGSVAAIAGSLYTDDVGGDGTTLYIKESGTSTVGWVAVFPTGELNDTWLIANNDAPFGTAPTALGSNSISVGNAARNVNGTDAIAIGTSAYCYRGGTVAIGRNAAAQRDGGISIGDGATLSGTNSNTANNIAIGAGAHATNSGPGIALGKNAYTGFLSSIAIGSSASTNNTTGYNIAIGDNAYAGGGNCIIIGHSSVSSAANQTIIGPELTSVDVTSDVAYSLKAGSGVTGEHNFIHLHSKGKLELVGDEAQFVAPTYTLATLPTVVEGGMIYVSDATGSSLTGSQCFGNVSGSPALWVDVTTGIAVA